MANPLTRRALLGGASLAFSTLALGATALTAQEFEVLDPADLVPDRYTIREFLALDKNEIYMVNLAIKRNRTIRIGSYPPSESRALIRRAQADWPKTRAELAAAHGD